MHVRIRVEPSRLSVAGIGELTVCPDLDALARYLTAMLRDEPRDKAFRNIILVSDDGATKRAIPARRDLLLESCSMPIIVVPSKAIATCRRRFAFLPIRKLGTKFKSTLLSSQSDGTVTLSVWGMFEVECPNAVFF